jgi:hypothetical protein
MGRIQRQFVILLTTATIIMGISTVAMVLPHAAYASEDEEDRFLSSDDDENDGDCESDEQPASIDGKISCMGPGECYSEQFEFAGKKVKHCNSLMTAE